MTQIEPSLGQLEFADPLPSKPPREITQSFPSNSEGTRAVFALIIGINDYRSPDLLPLRGAVNDARAFQKYLLDSYDDKGLQVPPQNILLVENENATRSAILDGFKSHLLENEDIPDHGGATMIFFFAGHGSRALATGNLIARDLMIKTICPVDERTTNAAGKYVHAIPDYVLGRLLWQLAEKKGRNITVILDSCNSEGGLGRDFGSARTATTDSLPIPPELDSHLWSGDADTVQHYRARHPTATFYVLLAACRPDEIAREVDYQGIRRGRFTTSLIGLLRWARLTTTTYKELMSRTEGWSEQHPHCGGSTDRLIFDGNYPATGRRAVPLKPQDPPPPGSTRIPTSSELFSVAMGAVEGVVPGTEFSAYDANNIFLCTFVAQSVEVAKTNLEHPFAFVVSIPPGSRAVVSDWKNHAMILRVHTSPDFLHTTHLFPKVSQANRLPRFVQAKADEAHLIIRTDEENSKIVLELCEGTTIRKAQREMRFPLGNPARLPDAMDGVAHFNYFLERSNKEDPLLEVLPNNGVMVPGFALEMHRLLGDFPTRKPDPSVGQNGNMVVDGAVRFASEEGARYGFTICNTSPEDLYPYLFYFDPETFTIQHWYLPEFSHAESPLPSGKRLTLGMGGERAFQFTPTEGQEESSGFLKLFVAREFVDLGWIEQRRYGCLRFTRTLWALGGLR
ncbi:caspase domain-containing protein [Mycena leptocephala]|nr:caspase domain-containing protein [Mycena leptocephala]